MVHERLRNRWVLYGAVALVAGGVAAALIVVSVVGSSDKKSTAQTTAPVALSSEPTATSGAPVTVPGAADTQKLLAGIPQKLNVLGKASAPVTLIEFADPQCPFCRDFTVNALPGLVEEYVRPGKVKLVFFGMSFIGPDSETALRATYAAGLQSRLWNFLDLLYKNQGQENSGWVTDGLLQTIGTSIPGFVAPAAVAAQSGSEVDAAIQASAQQAQSASVDQTPTFFAGKSGTALQHVDVKSLTPEAFRPTLDALLK